MKIEFAINVSFTMKELLELVRLVIFLLESDDSIPILIDTITIIYSMLK